MNPLDVQLLVLAKAPVAGRAKTRLCPPCTPEEAARLAAAALADTLDAVRATPCRRRVLVLEGAAGEWVPDGVEVLPQRGGGLDDRLSAAFADAGGPSLLIGMDTPQVTPALLSDAMAMLSTPGVSAVLGAARDGGWWAAGLRRPDPYAFLGVPMSTAHTGAEQWRRLASRLGTKAVVALPVLRDVDTIADAEAVADLIPASRFARAYRATVGAFQ